MFFWLPNYAHAALSMIHPSYIDSFDYIFEGMTLRKYTHNLTFRFAKYVKTFLADIYYR